MFIIIDEYIIIIYMLQIQHRFVKLSIEILLAIVKRVQLLYS